ncbi:hypothetical protein [Pleurocapsa sp. FMAR1]|nr:hypothetical protein [Pleurocapsa sp. FMAR1]
MTKINRPIEFKSKRSNGASLAEEIEQLLYHRLACDRERRGRSVGFLA